MATSGLGIWCGGYINVLSRFCNIITHIYNDAYYPCQLTIQYHNPKLRSSHRDITCLVELSTSDNTTATCSIYSAKLRNIIYRCTIRPNVATQLISLLTPKIIHCIRMRQSLGVDVLDLTANVFYLHAHHLDLHNCTYLLKKSDFSRYFTVYFSEGVNAVNIISVFVMIRLLYWDMIGYNMAIYVCKIVAIHLVYKYHITSYNHLYNQQYPLQYIHHIPLQYLSPYVTE